jgi:hypothetical protein
MNLKLGRMRMEAVVVYFEVLFPDLSGEADENPQSEYLVYGRGFEPGTYRIWGRINY